MEFTNEFIEKIQLTPEQVTALSEATTAHEAAIKQEFATKANTDAEGILAGVAGSVEKLTGVRREQGQKYKDYLSTASELYFAGTKSSLERKEAELDEKIKNGTGSEAIKAELQSTKEALDVLKQKEAKFADWEENDYKGKYEKATQDLSVMQKRVAFNSVKPNFPDTANPFEVSAKWSAAQKAIEEKYEIVLDDENTPWGVDKTNEFKKVKLSELIAKDKDIEELTKGRVVTGPGSKPKGNIKIEGLPFEVPENATAEERQTAVKDHLASLNIPKTSAKYAKMFTELNAKILEKTSVK